MAWTCAAASCAHGTSAENGLPKNFQKTSIWGLTSRARASRLRPMIAAAGHFEQLQAEYEALGAENKSLRDEIRFLKEKVQYLLKQLFGSKSEKIDPNQLTRC